MPRARLGFAAYLAAMTVLVVPIALAGVTLLGSDAAPDLYVLALPAALGQPWLLGAALLGQLADATSIDVVYKVCSFLPAIGLLTAFLPNVEPAKKA